MTDSLDSDRRQRQPGDPQSLPAVPPLTVSPAFLKLYEVSEASDVGLGFAHFAEALSTIRRRFLPSEVNDSQIIRFYTNLHLKDLALAQACSRGRAVAWELFLGRYREKLYTAAFVLTKNEFAARELSDSLSGDLFERREDENGACSKLASYSGRGSLEAWLKAVLAHAYIDRYRSQRRVVSLDQRLAAIATACLSEPPTHGRALRYRSEPDTAACLSRAIEEAWRQRTPEQRFLLAAYFYDGWSLAAIAKTLDVHESTVSRRMDRVLRRLRHSITGSLRQQGISSREIKDSLLADVLDLPIEIRGVPLQGVNLARE
jgi:RNA polymerase sigma-70 factor (ECF subfamily)